MGGEVTSTTDTSNSSGLPRDFFPKIYAQLESQGDYLTPEQKASVEKITNEAYERENKAKLAGINVGALPRNLAQILGSLLQNLFSGERAMPTSIEEFCNYIKDALSGATNSGKQYVANAIAVEAYKGFRGDPSLAGIADKLAGFSDAGFARDIGGRASIVDQVSDLEKIPKGTISTLNPTPVQVADASDGAGPGLPRRPLTGQALGA